MTVDATVGRRLPALSATAIATLHYGTLAAIVFAGAALRVTALNRQSLWFDEIDVVVRARQPLGRVLQTFVTAGENGPLYNLLLALWVRFAGISEIAVRFPSAMAGTLSIPLVYVFARRVSNGSSALFAAALLAISPYHVWYSQEAKMYALVVLLALASTACFVEALARNRRGWWIAYALVTTLMFYTHVTAVLVFVAQAVYFAATRRTWSGRGRAWLLVAAALTLPYLPIAAWAVRVVGGGVTTWQPNVSLVDAARIFGVKFAVNRASPVVEERGAALYAILALAGVAVLSLRRSPARPALLLAALALVPVLGLYLVSLRQSVFSDRYAIVALPSYLTLVAAGTAWLTRRRGLWPLGVTALFLLLVFAWGPLRDVNRSAGAEKEDWRSAYADVANRAEPGDAFILHPGYIVTTAAYFSERDPRLRAHEIVTIPSFRVGWLSEPLMAEMIRQQAGSATRFWLIESPDRVTGEDPDRVLARWLAANGRTLYRHEVNGVRITLYEQSPPAR